MLILYCFFCAGAKGVLRTLRHRQAPLVGSLDSAPLWVIGSKVFWMTKDSPAPWSLGHMVCMSVAGRWASYVRCGPLIEFPPYTRWYFNSLVHLIYSVIGCVSLSRSACSWSNRLIVRVVFLLSKSSWRVRQHLAGSILVAMWCIIFDGAEDHKEGLQFVSLDSFGRACGRCIYDFWTALALFFQFTIALF